MYLFHYITHLLDGDGYIFIEKYNFLFWPINLLVQHLQKCLI